MTATNDAVLITEPPPASSRCGMPCLQHRKTLRRLTSWTRCQASTEVSSTEVSSLGLMPGVVEQDVDAPEGLARPSYTALTSSSEDTSAWKRQLARRALGQVDPHDRRALGGEQLRGLRPDPDAAPVITHTLPSSRPAISAALRRDVDALDLRVVVQRVRAQLAADARLLEAAERAWTRGPRCSSSPTARRSRARGPRAGRGPRRASRSNPTGRRSCRWPAPPPRPRPLNGITHATGPKISSRAARSSLATGHSTVGGNQ